MTAIHSTPPHACQCQPALTIAFRGTLASGPFQLVLRWWQRAQQRHALRDLDDRLLADIGVTRAAAKKEVMKFFWM